jgi:DNA mismatch repair protein MutS
MDSETDIRDLIRNIVSKFFSNAEISQDIKNVDIGAGEMNTICRYIFNDICDLESPIINNDVKIDLELFEGIGNDKESTIYSNINMTHTNLGGFLLKKILENPTKEIKLLQSRQSVIRKISNNKELKKILDDKLPKIKESELDLLYLWKTLDEETSYLFDMVYFQNKFLKMFNKNEFVLRMYNYYVILFSPIYGILTPILMVLAPFIFMKYYFKKTITFSLYFKLLRVAVSGLSNITKFDPTQDTSKWSWGQMVSLLMWLVFYIHALYSNIQLAKNTNEISNIIHHKVNKIAVMVKEGYSIFEVFGKEIEGYSKLVPYDVQKHFGILWDDIFMEEPHIMSNKGIILKTFKILNEKKENLIDLLRFVSTIDVYNSLSNLYLEDNYCFPTYDEKALKPIIKAKQIWYPILKDRIVRNSITIGDKYPLNVLITGPNAGGKSTFIKGLTISLIFAQTIGIVPGEEFHLTPFSFLNTYLNIPDCKGKESLFEAEMRRSLEHIRSLEELPKEEFSYVIMDEIFSSTNPNEGVSGAYAIADKLSQFKNNVCLITSHYSHLTHLEKEGKYKNYKIPISRDKQNNIIYNYKLMHGVSNQYIALELLERKGFDKDIVRKAQQISRELCNNMESIRPKRKLKKKKKPIVKKNEEIHESTGKESTPREEPKETHNEKELLQVRELPKTEEVSK